MLRAVRPCFFRVSSVLAFRSFAHVPDAPPDPILGLGIAFAADTHPKKVNLGVGVYRGDDGKPFVLNCVRKAEDRVHQKKLDFEYAPITGVPGFVDQARNLAFGAGNAAVQAKRVASTQSLSGTGALRLAGEYLRRFGPPSKKVFLPAPTWGNHASVFRDSGLEPGNYPYYNSPTKSIDVDATVKFIETAPQGSIFLLHACAHNPTGLDPTSAQWEKIAAALNAHGHLPLVDMAYQGFASGDADRDGFAWRLISKSFPCFVGCQSMAKSFGLYGQRIGAMHIQTDTAESTEKILAQVKLVVRAMYSNPPIHGARIVEEVLKDAALTEEWKGELKQMADRMNGVRGSLVKRLGEIGSKHDWNHITKQIGMMAFTGLNLEQVNRLKSEYHIYMTADGRAAITGLNSRNVDYVAECFHAVSK